MRLPLAAQFKSRPNSLTKDARVRNGVIEKRGEQAVVRSRSGSADLGLVEAAQAQLLTCWNGLLSVQGDSLASLVVVYTPPGYFGDVDFYPWADGDVGYARYNGDLLLQPIYIPLDDGDLVLAGSQDALEFYSWYGARGSLVEQSLGFTFDDVSFAWCAARNSSAVLVTTFDDGISGDGVRAFVSSASGTPSFTNVYSSSTSGDPRADSSNEYLFIYTTNRLRYSSNNGVSWTQITNPSGIEYFDGSFYLSGYWYFVASVTGPTSIRIFRTDTFASLSEVTLSGDTLRVTASNFGRQKCVTTFKGKVVISTTTGIITSINGESWSEASALVGTVYSDADYLYVITSVGVFISEDAVTFSELLSASFVIDNGVLPTAGSISGKFCLNDASNITYEITVGQSEGGDSVEVTPIADLTPASPSKAITSGASGAAQSTQQLLLKSSDQAWVYTRD